MPPGSLRVLSEEELGDQLFLLRRAEELGPIFKVWRAKMTTCIVGLEMGRRFLAENEDKLRAGTVDLSPLFPHGFLRGLEGKIHRKYRRMFLDAFNATPLEPHDAAIREIMREGLDNLVTASQPVDSAIIRKTLAFVSNAVLQRLVFGVKRDTEMFNRFSAAYHDYAPDGTFIVARPEVKPAYQTLRDLLLEQVELISVGDAAEPSMLGQMLSKTPTLDETQIGNFIHLAETARFDLHSLWCWIVKHLGDNPDAIAIARSADGAPASYFAATQAIPRESLRLEQSELVLRVATKDIVFDGYFIPKRSFVRICVWESHKDAHTFKDPFRFDCRRFMDRKIPASQFSPFGLDKHRCLGADWTYLLSEKLVEELVQGYDWTIVKDSAPVLGRFHFQPGSEFAINMEKRTDKSKARRA